MENSHQTMPLLYYWYKKSQVSFDELIEIEFAAFKHAMISQWKLFKAYKIDTLENEEEIFLVGKN